MREPIVDQVFDFRQLSEKSTLYGVLRNLRGRYTVTIRKWYPDRTNLQNRYYRGCFVTPFFHYLRDQGHDNIIVPNDAHLILAYRFLRREIVDEQTGEVLGIEVKSTADLDTKEFNEYLEQCAQFLAETCGIVVPEPDKNYKNERRAKVTT
jgi:hypothetical protein